MTVKRAIFGVLATGLLSFGCDVDHTGVDTSGYYFSGTVYDGFQGKPVEAYTISLTQASGTTKTKVTKSANGAFEIGPLKPGSDYKVVITAEGYRDFFAVEPLKAKLPDSEDHELTQYYEAYLFPSTLRTPPVTFEIFGQGSAASRPSGKVRFSPAGTGTSALNLGGIHAPSVVDQLWANDADRKAGTVFKDLNNGVVDVGEGDLVLGVTYTATVYDVSGYAYESFAFTAGLDGHHTVVLSDLSDEKLQIINSSLDTGAPRSDGTVSFTFNYPIEFSPTTPESVVRELIDDDISISSADADGDGTANVLTNTDDPNRQEHGTSVSISGNTLTLKWNNYNSESFEPDAFDSDDLYSVTYDVSGIGIRRVGGSELGAERLENLLETDEVTVNLKQPRSF
jgi:hypothetical protein